MQIMINISDADYNSITEDYISYADTESGRVYNAIKEGTVLPDNPTNGDIIKALFPNVRLDDGGEWRHIFWGVQAKASFSQDWWDAPYKAESEE